MRAPANVQNVEGNTLKPFSTIFLQRCLYNDVFTKMSLPRYAFTTLFYRYV
jgi:hypothetical protein